MIDGITEFVFIINLHDDDVSICAPKELICEYDDSYEIAIAGGYGKYFPKTDWKILDHAEDIEAEETYDFD
jgi:hypothetical protein